MFSFGKQAPQRWDHHVAEAVGPWAEGTTVDHSCCRELWVAPNGAAASWQPSEGPHRVVPHEKRNKWPALWPEPICITFPKLPYQITINLVAHNNRNLFPHSSGSQKPDIKVSEGCAPAEGSGGQSFLDLSSFWGYRCPWLVATQLQSLPHLCVAFSSERLFPVCVFMRTFVIGSRACPDNLG